MTTIRDVLNKLTKSQRKGVATRRAKRRGKSTVQAHTVAGLAKSYGDEWVELLQDMTKGGPSTSLDCP